MGESVKDDSIEVVLWNGNKILSLLEEYDIINKYFQKDVEKYLTCSTGSQRIFLHRENLVILLSDIIKNKII